MERKWWQDAVIYQVYLRSFKDSNNDGIGDFNGLVSKLDYIKDLGANAIWVSPHYKSPMDDNGYDISDFYSVSEDYGSMSECLNFINEAHDKKIKVIFDLVLNHTSDEHPWFKAALDKTHKEHEKYKEYYIWQKPKINESGEMKMPTNWLSWFGGPVWEYVEDLNEYYLHIFSKKMPDLNWKNESMKKDLKEMINWWIDKGVDGFRVDAANHLEKDWNFPEANPGYEYFSSLPKHHDYLDELGKEIFFPNDIMTIGEAGGASKEEALKYCGFDSNEFDMLIQFGHCWNDCDWDNKVLTGKWAKGEINLLAIKESFKYWFDILQGKGWNIIYWHNHDQPRILSHYGNDTLYRERSAKMLLYTLYLMPGTPIIYQGEEIGMSKLDFKELNDFKDVEVFTEYENFIKRGATHEMAMQALRDRSRDNARSPMQWDESLNSGFSQSKPWMKVNGNYTEINVKQQEKDPNSVFNSYKSVLKFRKNNHLNDASIDFIDIKNNDSFIYKTETDKEVFLVIANFREYDIDIRLDFDVREYEFAFSNYLERKINNYIHLVPYEALVYKLIK